MLSTKSLHQLADYSTISRPTFAAPPALARETIYMPSAVAARVLGRASEEQRSKLLKARQPAQKAL